MYIPFEQLVQEMGKRMTVHAYNVTSQIIRDVGMIPWSFEPGETVLREDAAYVCEYRKLKEYDFNLKLAPLICVLEQDARMEEVFFRNRSVILVIGRTVADVLVDLIHIMYDYGTGNSRLTELTRDLTHCRDVKELIDMGFEILGNPLVLTDENQQIIAHTDVDRISAGTYRDVIAMGHMLIGHPQSDRGEEYWEPVDYPFLEGKRNDLPGIICKRLSIGGRTEGYLHVLQYNREIRSSDTPATELLGNLLSIALWNQPWRSGTESRFRRTERFLRDLLDNDRDEEYIQEQLKLIGLKPKNCIYAAVVNQRRVDMPVTVSYYELAQKMAELLPGCCAFLYRNSIFMVIQSDEEITDFEAYFAPVLPLLREHHMTVGVSNAFSSLGEIQAHGFQSRKAQQIGLAVREEDCVYLYRDYSIYYMIELCLKNENLESLCVPELKKLIKYNQKEGSEFVETLKTYLRCGRSKSQTARELYVHLNTVKYRLAQIQNIMGLDLDNDDNALKLMLSFRMLEFSDLFPAGQLLNF